MNTTDSATMEFWARATSATPPGSVSFHRYSGSVEHKDLTIASDGSINYLYAGSPWDQLPHFGGAPDAPAGSFPLDQDWHHVAFVRRAAGTWAIYVDGYTVLSLGPGTGLGGGCWVTCGVMNGVAPTTLVSDGGWQIDSVRFSSVERYFANFTPERRFASDAFTSMLLDLDEGSGATVHDFGVATQVGQVIGVAQWIPVCSSPSSCCSNGPTTFCTGKVNSLGCLPSIGHSGNPTLSGPDDFHITADNILNDKYGLLLWSTEPNNVPFVGGTLCLRQPFRRTAMQESGGNVGTQDCTGTFDFHFSHQVMSHSGLSNGQVLYAQYWYRDPGFPVGFHVGLTNGLKFSICP